VTSAEHVVSGSEVKVKLEGLGLPPSWLAAKTGRTMRTIVRWFDVPASPQVIEVLEEASQRTLDEMLTMISAVGDDQNVVLTTYRTDKKFVNDEGWPASWHRALTFRVVEHLRAEGRTVRVEYAE